MKLNFDTRSQSYGSSLAHFPGKNETINPPNLKSWWQGLMLEEKEIICRLDASDIVSDLVKVSNDALLLCKLSTTYRSRSLISLEKSMNKATGTTTQAFEFNLIDKEVLDNGLAELFSSFCLINAKKESSNSEETQPKSYIGVKREKLDSVLGQLINATFDLTQGEKLFFQGKDFSRLYSSLANRSAPCILFETNLPSRLKTLFERLAIYSLLLEYKICLSYEEAILANTHMKPQTDLFSLAMTFERDMIRQPPLILAKTVSQLERERLIEALDQHSTASDSPSNPIDMSYPHPLDSEELAQKILQKCPAEFIPKSLAEETISESQSTSQDETPQCMAIYDGFYLGDLDITFDPSDTLLTSDEENEIHALEQRPRNDRDQSNYNQIRRNAPYFHQSQLPYQSPPFNPGFYNQQMNSMMTTPFSYGAPQMFVAPQQNNMKPTSFNSHFQPINYVSASNYPHLSQGNERSFFYPQQTFIPNQNPVYFSQEKLNHFGGRDKPRYEKPKLPPRFQKKRENQLKNNF